MSTAQKKSSLNHSPSNVNIFRHYSQEENRFTNGLISILSVSPLRYTRAFFKDLLGLELDGAFETFVLREIPGHADAQLCGSNWCIWFETKIVCGNLSRPQLRRHLKRLRNCRGRMKRLVLLTPDDSKSNYIREIRSKYKPMVLPLEWRRVYNFLESVPKRHGPVFGQLVSQFLSEIHDCIFDQDFVGIIQKMTFGDWSGVDHNTYLEEMKKGEWKWWNTPRKYKKLNGTGRKLLLYDKTREAITVEVEIAKVEETKQEKDFPWRNTFVRDTLQFDEKLIPLKRIVKVPGFENFVSARAPYRNVTHEQYRLLKGLSAD